jgi:hypothetical protein
MTSPPSTESVVVAELSRLVEVQHRATAALREGARQVDAAEVRMSLTGVADRLEVEAQEVGRDIIELGGSPPTAEESKQPIVYDEEAMKFAAGKDDQLMDMARELSTSVTETARPLVRRPAYQAQYAQTFSR